MTQGVIVLKEEEASFCSIRWLERNTVDLEETKVSPRLPREQGPKHQIVLGSIAVDRATALSSSSKFSTKKFKEFNNLESNFNFFFQMTKYKSMNSDEAFVLMIISQLLKPR